MIIIGAGLSGLIAASMLRDQVDSVLEKQSSLPNNHSALLRFRSSVVGDAIGIPFQKVDVMKAVQHWRNPIADAIAYSMKCTGKAQLRSIATAHGKIEQRYIAPYDLIERLSKQIGFKIAYDQDVRELILGGRSMPIISTMPMPALMDILGWKEKPKFEWRPGTVINCLMPDDVDFCATIYLPDPQIVAYRASVTDRQLIIEIADSNLSEVSIHRATNQALDALGLTHFARHVADNRYHKVMDYAKITPISESIRRRFMLWATEHYNVYSLGRFATWRPGLLLDDLVNDVRVIERLIKTPGDTYRHKLKG